jgi:hypothetical protein
MQARKQVHSSHVDKGTEAGGCRGRQAEAEASWKRQAGALTQECRQMSREGIR